MATATAKAVATKTTAEKLAIMEVALTVARDRAMDVQTAIKLVLVLLEDESVWKTG